MIISEAAVESWWVFAVLLEAGVGVYMLLSAWGVDGGIVDGVSLASWVWFEVLVVGVDIHPQRNAFPAMDSIGQISPSVIPSMCYFQRMCWTGRKWSRWYKDYKWRYFWVGTSPFPRQSQREDPQITALMDSQDSVVEQTVHSLGRIKQIGKEKDDLVQVSLSMD